MVKIDSERLQQTEKDVRAVVAEETGDLLRHYFEEALENTEWGITQAQQEYEQALAEYAHARQVLLDEARRRGVDLGYSLPAATACRRKAAKGATGPKVCSSRKARP